VSGKFFSKMKERQSSKESYDDAEAKRLWDEGMKLSGLAWGRLYARFPVLGPDMPTAGFD
jgi:hypothetical protein